MSSISTIPSNPRFFAYEYPFAQGCPAPQVTVRVKVKVKSRLNTVIGADFHIGSNNRIYQQTG